MKRNRRRRMRRNPHWSTEDKLLAVAGVVAAVGIFAIVKQRRDAAAVPTAGLRGMRGLGAYFIDPVNIPFSGIA